MQEIRAPTEPTATGWRTSRSAPPADARERRSRPEMAGKNATANEAARRGHSRTRVFRGILYSLHSPRSSSELDSLACPLGLVPLERPPLRIFSLPRSANTILQVASAPSVLVRHVSRCPKLRYPWRPKAADGGPSCSRLSPRSSPTDRPDRVRLRCTAERAKFKSAKFATLFYLYGHESERI
jgi:hypothetical protein